MLKLGIQANSERKCEVLMLDSESSDLKQCGTLSPSPFLDQPENEEYYTNIYIYIYVDNSFNSSHHWIWNFFGSMRRT